MNNQPNKPVVGDYQVLECVHCHKRTIRIEAESRNFNTGFCAYCGYGLEPVVYSGDELQKVIRAELHETYLYGKEGATNHNPPLLAERKIMSLFKDYAADIERRARIAELQDTIVSQGNYAPNRSYSNDESGIVVIGETELNDRLKQLRAEGKEAKS